jgi:hypothetical protein
MLGGSTTTSPSIVTAILRHKDYIVVFMDSPRSGARHRALTVVDTVCVDLDRADHAAPDKS